MIHCPGFASILIRVEPAKILNLALDKSNRGAYIKSRRLGGRHQRLVVSAKPEASVAVAAALLLSG